MDDSFYQKSKASQALHRRKYRIDSSHFKVFKAFAYLRD